MRPHLLPSKSLWSYNPIPRGCVLYLPLWNPNLSGPIFKSTDPLGHTCTVTGATYGPDGWIFDGTNNHRIDLGTPTALQITTMSVIAWVKKAAIDAGHMIIGSANDGWAFYFSAANRLAFGKYATSEAVSTSTYTSTTAFVCVALTYDAITTRFYANGVADGASAYADPTFVTKAKSIGVSGIFLEFDFNGIIGEVWVYNRVLSAGEIAHIYSRTRGTYQ